LALQRWQKMITLKSIVRMGAYFVVLVWLGLLFWALLSLQQETGTRQEKALKKNTSKTKVKTIIVNKAIEAE
jgi:cytoskeletal protein RodZ